MIEQIQRPRMLIAVGFKNGLQSRRKLQKDPAHAMLGPEEID